MLNAQLLQRPNGSIKTMSLAATRNCFSLCLLNSVNKNYGGSGIYAIRVFTRVREFVTGRICLRLIFESLVQVHLKIFLFK